nr:helix-turn-helix transcriptional regulator [Geomicrobium halophilum]
MARFLFMEMEGKRMGFINCNLNVLMAERGLNIQRIKENTTLSRTTISYLVNNYGGGIHYETLKQLCHLLRCQPGDIFTYYDFDVSFEVMERKEENSSLQGEAIETALNLQVDIFYNGKLDPLQLMVYFDGNKRKNIIDSEVQLNIARFYPFAVQKYFYDQLEKFLIKNWESV